MRQFVGCAYVFEGSKLGAKIIYNSLLNNKNLSSNSIQYFNFLANENTNFCSWSQWVENLYSYVMHNNLDFSQISAGAENCFACLYAWFKKP